MLKNYNAIFKAIFCLIILCATSVSHTGRLQLEDSEVYIPERLGKLSLVHDEGGFHVLKDNKVYHVQNCFADSMLRRISRENLEKFLHNGYVSVNRMSDNEYTLRAHGRLLGGGPIAGAIAYWATKSLCYGTAVAAASTAVVVTGGAAAGALTTAGVAAATGGASLGAVAVSGAIAATTGGTAAAVTATAATVTAAGGFAGAVAAVETASLGVSALFTICPFLP